MIGQTVYLVTDDSQSKFIITGIVDRLNHKTYLISNINGEHEVFYYEISAEKSII